MKTPTIGAIGAICVALTACSTAATPPADAMAMAGSGGVVGSAGATSAGSGGAGNSTAAGAGNSTSAGGGNSTSEGGASAGTGGTVTTGGVPSGGSSGSGGATAGTGGGAAAGAAGAGVIDPTTFAGAWDGALIQYGCGDNGSGYDCSQPSVAACKSYDQASNPNVSTIPPSNGVPTSWTMGGTAGTIYSLTFHLRGVVEVISYVGGTRAAGNASVLTTPRNLFQVGGVPQDNSGPSFDYNTYELHVTPAVAGEANVYYLNSVTVAQNPHADNSPTTHLTFDVDYSATIKVPGGGKVTMKVTDTNCRQVQNCGDAAGNTCAKPRTISLAGSMPAAPAFAQPLNNSGFYGQWVFFDVTNVTVAQ